VPDQAGLNVSLVEREFTEASEKILSGLLKIERALKALEQEFKRVNPLADKLEKSFDKVGRSMRSILTDTRKAGDAFNAFVSSVRVAINELEGSFLRKGSLRRLRNEFRDLGNTIWRDMKPRQLGAAFEGMGQSAAGSYTQEFQRGVQQKRSQQTRFFSNLYKTVGSEVGKDFGRAVGQSMAIGVGDSTDEAQRLGRRIGGRLGNRYGANIGKAVGNTLDRVWDTLFTRDLPRKMDEGARKSAQRTRSAFQRTGTTVVNEINTGVRREFVTTERLMRDGFDDVADVGVREAREGGRRISRAYQQAVDVTPNVVRMSESLEVMRDTFEIMERAGQMMAAPVNAAVDFEAAMGQVAKTLDTSGLTAAQEESLIAQLSADIRELSTAADSPLAGLEDAQLTLANIAAEAGQLGVAREDMIDFVDTVGQLQISTDLGEEAAFNIARMGTLLRDQNYQQMGSSLVNLGNNFAATEKEISEFTLRIAAAGRTAGLETDQILGISAAMANVGLNAEAGGSAFTRVVNELAAASASLATGGSPELAEFARVANMTSEEFATAFSERPEEAIFDFIEGLGELDRAAQIEALDTLGLDGLRTADTLSRLALSSDELARALDLANEGYYEQNALLAEAQRFAASTRSALNRLGNVVRNLGISIGTLFLPPLKAVVDFLSDMLTRLDNFVNENRRFAQVVVSVGSALGVAAGAMFTFQMSSLTLGTVLGTTIGFITGPVGWIAGLSLLAAGLLNFTDLGDLAISRLQAMQVQAQAMLATGQAVYNLFRDAASGTLRNYGRITELSQNGILGAVFGENTERVLASTVDLIDQMRAPIQRVLDDFRRLRLSISLLGTGSVNTQINRVRTTFKALLSEVSSAAQVFAEQFQAGYLGQRLQQAVDFASDQYDRLQKKAVDAFKAMIPKRVQGEFRRLTGTVNEFASTVRERFREIVASVIPADLTFRDFLTSTRGLIISLATSQLPAIGQSLVNFAGALRLLATASGRAEGVEKLKTSVLGLADAVQIRSQHCVVPGNGHQEGVVPLF